MTHEHTADKDVACTTSYFAEYRDFGGNWCRIQQEHGTSTEARTTARDWFRDNGYGDVLLRVVKVHTHTMTEVIDESRRHQRLSARSRGRAPSTNGEAP